MPNWNDVLSEIVSFQKENPPRSNQAFDEVRRKYLRLLFEKTGRNVIAYYSAFLSKPGISGLEINDEDKNGFMMAIHNLDRRAGLDLFLHTPGGGISAAQSLVNYLQKMFDGNIRAFVPQIAMSAGTIIACCCKVIYMAKHSNLGPIDPQLMGIPAYGVIEEFRRAYREIKKDPAKVYVWQPILGKYHPTFLSQCENAIKLSKSFVLQQLENVMFEGDPKAKEKALKAERALSSFRGNKVHDKHLHYEDCKEIGLKVELIEQDQSLQDLVLTIHHCYMHSLMNTPSFKIIENQNGVAFVKQQLALQFGPQPVIIPGSIPKLSSDLR